MRGVVRVGCGCRSRAGVGARMVGASCGRAKLDAVDEKDMVQPLDGVQVSRVRVRDVLSRDFEMSLSRG
jgi:hypothetical protein